MSREGPGTTLNGCGILQTNRGLTIQTTAEVLVMGTEEAPALDLR